MIDDVAAPHPNEPRPGMLWLLAGVLGLAAAPAAWYAIQPYQTHVVSYEVQLTPTRQSPSVFIFSALIFLAPLALAILAARNGVRGSRGIIFFSSLAPTVTTFPLGIFSFLATPPPFHLLLAAMLGAGASAYLSGRRLAAISMPRRSLALLTLISVIIVLTVIHFRIQLNFYNHFMFGHADIGHFTEELKNALAGRGLRSDSFDNTRLGWHFVPLLYVLAPGYALWPSPMYLMFLCPLVLHLGALPVYWFVRRRTESLLAAWLCGLAWLLLPSLSRLVYSNTYGFAWLYCSVPVLCVLLGATLLQRWKLCWILVAVLLLSRETNTAATLGFGVYLALFSPQRRAGVVIAGTSVVYALLCALVIIPYFAAAGKYERLNMFGELGDSVGALAVSSFTKPDVFFGRLIRAPSVNLLLLLLSTMCFLPIRGWKLALAALPAVLVHLLLEGTDWLSIKFWHHAMVVPFLFFAALSVMGERPGMANAERRRSKVEGMPHSIFDLRHSSSSVGIALALLMSAAWGHYFFGFSPLSKAYEVYAADPFFQNPDPRLSFVDRLRREIPRDRTVLATERLAAHFTDYKRLYTGRRLRMADYLILDRSDAWDSSGLPKRISEFAANDNYELYAEQEPVVVFRRRTPAPLD